LSPVASTLGLEEDIILRVFHVQRFDTATTRSGHVRDPYFTINDLRVMGATVAGNAHSRQGTE